MTTDIAAGSTVEKIINVALDMVQRRGFMGFSFRDIAAEVGIKTASIHYHFPTKPDLARAVLSEVRGGFELELARIDREVDGIEQKLRAFVEIFDDTFGDGDRLCPFCMVACAQDGVPDFVREEVQGFWSAGEQWVANLVELGKSTGSFHRALDPAASGRVLVAMLEGAMATARAFDDRSRLHGAADWFLAQLKA
ncbi:MAG: TetR/AcrR family transcriptional regulator [Pseudomonadota bacterium]